MSAGVAEPVWVCVPNLHMHTSHRLQGSESTQTPPAIDRQFGPIEAPSLHTNTAEQTWLWGAGGRHLDEEGAFQCPSLKIPQQTRLIRFHRFSPAI